MANDLLTAADVARGVCRLFAQQGLVGHGAARHFADVPSMGSTTLRDALSQMITAGCRSLVVVDGEGRPRGVVTLESLTGGAE